MNYRNLSGGKFSEVFSACLSLELISFQSKLSSDENCFIFHKYL